MKRQAWQTWVAVLALLVIGAVLGIAIDRFHVRGGNHASALLEEIERNPMAVIDREISLRPDQRASVGRIIERYQATMDSAWGESNRQVRATVGAVINDITAQLDSAQARKFRALINKIHSSPDAFHQRGH